MSDLGGSDDSCAKLAGARPRLLVIGHRGASLAAPENTLAAFRRAMADGADGIEFDVQLARDGVPVVIHDRTLGRTASVKGKVRDFSSSELARIEVGSWFNRLRPKAARAEYALETVPSLEQVIASIEEIKAVLYLEMKCMVQESVPLALAVASVIRSRNLVDRTVVESFTLEAISAIKQLDGRIRTAALFARRRSGLALLRRRMIRRAKDFQAEELSLERSLATRRTVTDAQRHGLDVAVWTVDDPRWLARAVRDGVRAIITNDPARMAAERQRLGI